jgi:hypothetical protein
VNRTTLRTRWRGRVAPDSWLATVQLSRVVSGALGLGVPIAFGTLTGHGRIGVVASLGGLALTMAGKGNSFREQLPGLLYAIASGTLGMLVGSSIKGSGMGALFAIVLVAAGAAVLGGLSKPLVRGTTQFMLFVIIAANSNTGTTYAGVVTVFFFLGAIWAASLSLVLRPLFQALDIDTVLQGRVTAPPTVKYRTSQLLRRWRKSLLHLSGWRYTCRIVLCLFFAGMYGMLWPHHHNGWALLTVVIVVHRDIHAALRRTVERAAGTAIGVLLAGLLVVAPPSPWVVVTAVAVLSAARLLLMETSYVAYSAVQTPLVILLLDFGRVPSLGVVYDRLAATLIGCAVALVFGYFGWRRLGNPLAAPSERKGAVG